MSGANEMHQPHDPLTPTATLQLAAAHQPNLQLTSQLQPQRCSWPSHSNPNVAVGHPTPTPTLRLVLLCHPNSNVAVGVLMSRQPQRCGSPLHTRAVSADA